MPLKQIISGGKTDCEQNLLSKFETQHVIVILPLKENITICQKKIVSEKNRYFYSS